MAATGGDWLGWLAYEAGAWVEPAPHWRSPSMAVLWAGRYDPLLHLDWAERRLWLEGSDPARLDALAALVETLPAGEVPRAGDGPPPGDEGPPIPLNGWHWHTDRATFAAQVRRIRSLIAGGDLFQANLTACCEQRLAAPPDPLLLYGRLRRRCPAPFAGLAIGRAGAEAEAVLSASPERFLRLDADGLVESRPIKGTRPRHDDPERDAAAAAALVSSPKDRAENVMIVDLLRNDLGRVCQPGSIHVPQLVGLESYRQVHHLTSVVQGRLRPGLGAVDLLRACWPGGSISGAPKLRACRRLDELEPVPRGPYCGSLFRLGSDGSFDSSILIRSLMLRGSLLRAHAGCGIVADSDPAAEAEELGWKLQPLLEALA
jgi:para-aminobenzoate synthetase component 1